MLRWVVLLGGLLGFGWLGLLIKPKSFSTYPEESQPMDMVPLPQALPLVVRDFYQTIMGDLSPIVCSAVITGRGILRFGGIPFQGRLRFTHQAGYDYRHYIELTWFGRPFIKVNEHYRQGKGYMALPITTFEDLPYLNSAANQGLWGEALWFPSLYVTDSRVRWEAIDENHAKLIVPYPYSGDEKEQVFTVTFDANTHLIQRMETMRYREADKPRLNWILEASDWKDYHGVLLPSVATATWADQNYAWLTMQIDDVVYNADVSDYLLQEGV